jgi:hypothetical protein
METAAVISLVVIVAFAAAIVRYAMKYNKRDFVLDNDLLVPKPAVKKAAVKPNLAAAKKRKAIKAKAPAATITKKAAELLLKAGVKPSSTKLPTAPAQARIALEGLTKEEIAYLANSLYNIKVNPKLKKVSMIDAVLEKIKSK